MQDSSHDPIRIESGKYQADVQRGGTKEPFWYYVIRRMDSNEVVNIGKFETRKEAMEAAEQVLARMNPPVAAS